MAKKLLNYLLAICTAAMVLALLPVAVSAAESGACGDNLTWTLDDEGTLTISGKGEMNYGSPGTVPPWYRYISDIKSVVIEEGVTSIAYSAFSWYSNLTSITIPSSVTFIDEYAFLYSSKLEDVYISDMSAWCEIDFKGIDASPLCYGGNLYLNNKLQSSVTVPAGTKSIGKYAFYKCIGLTSITIPDSVESIGELAFYNCRSLKTVRMGNGIKSIGDSAFQDAESLTGVYIKDLAAWCGIEFSHNYNGGMSNPLYYAKKLYLNNQLVTNLVIPQGVSAISEYAFYRCTDITSVTIPDSVTSIGEGAFGGCTSVDSVYITDMPAWLDISFGSVSSNPAYSGADLYLNGVLVTEAEIPDGTVSVGYALSGCASIEKVIIPDSVTAIGDYAFYNCSGLTDITLPGSVESIGDSAFSGCTGLAGITIPDGVESIGDSAFSGCTGLAGITIPDGVESIGDYSFSGCTGLTGITIPDSVESIGYKAFSGCTHLTDITLPDTAISIGGDAFYNTACYNNDANWENGVLYIGNYLIRANTDLTGEYEVKAGTICIADNAFSPFYYSIKVTGITLPDSLVSIGADAFMYCESLKSIVIPDGVESIGYSAFSHCTSLSSITIPDGISEIVGSMFYGCTGLTSITLTESVKSIGNDAFYNCRSLTDVYYIGSEEAWSDIAVGSSNSYFTDAAVHYIPKVNIHYNINSGADGWVTTAASGSEAVLKTKIPARIGHTFLGWALSPDSSEAIYQPGDTINAVSEDITLYAVWEETSYTTTTMTNGIFMVSPTGVPEGSRIMFVCYKDGVLAHIETFEYDNSSVIPFSVNTEYDEVKVFVWNGDGDMVPVTEAENVL